MIIIFSWAIEIDEMYKKVTFNQDLKYRKEPAIGKDIRGENIPSRVRVERIQSARGSKRRLL